MTHNPDWRRDQLQQVAGIGNPHQVSIQILFISNNGVYLHLLTREIHLEVTEVTSGQMATASQECFAIQIQKPPIAVVPYLESLQGWSLCSPC